jgi:hypothetical protein
VSEKAIRRFVAWIVPVTVLTVFCLLSLALVFTVGVGCGDDAYHAGIAKNLARGLGYTSTIQDGRTDFIALQFDPRVGVGPTIILPASLIIRIFGNTYWAPGLASVIVWSSLCVVIGLLIRKYQPGIRLSLAIISFFYLGLALTTFHFEQWYALLGEIPAALLIILSVLLSFRDGSRVYQFLSGLAISLAVQAKLLSLVAFVVFLLVGAIFYVLHRLKKESAGQKGIIANFGYLLIGFVIPLLAFEMWKFFELGSSGFMDNWKSYLSFISNKGMDRGQTLSQFALYKRRSASIYQGFGITLQSVAFMLALAGLFVSRDKVLWRIYSVLVSMVISYLLWWIFISVGWERYFIIPLILIIAVASLPFLSSYPRKWLLLYFMLIVIWPAGVWDRIPYPLSLIDSGYFMPTRRTEALLKASDILSQGKGKNRVLTQWWATAANLEYISDSCLIFTTYRDETREYVRPYWVAADTKFIDPNDKDFMRMLNNCRGLRKIGDYLVGKCE